MKNLNCLQCPSYQIDCDGSTNLCRNTGTSDFVVTTRIAHAIRHSERVTNMYDKALKKSFNLRLWLGYGPSTNALFETMVERLSTCSTPSIITGDRSAFDKSFTPSELQKLSKYRCYFSGTCPYRKGLKSVRIKIHTDEVKYCFRKEDCKRRGER